MLRCLFLIAIVAITLNCVPFKYEHSKESLLQINYDDNNKDTLEVKLKSPIKRAFPGFKEPENQSDAPLEEDEVSPSPEQYPPVDSKFSLSPFFVGAFITAACFLLLILGLCFLLRPTGHFCDNFLKRPGELAYAKRKRQEKKLARAREKQMQQSKEQKQEMQAEKKKMLEAKRVEEKHKDQEQAQIIKQKQAERKERQKERLLVAKEKERRRRDQEKAKRARQQEINKELKRKLREQEKKDKEIFARAEEDLKKQERQLKSSIEPQTHKPHKKSSEEIRRRGSQSRVHDRVVLRSDSPAREPYKAEEPQLHRKLEFSAQEVECAPTLNTDTNKTPPVTSKSAPYRGNVKNADTSKTTSK